MLLYHIFVPQKWKQDESKNKIVSIASSIESAQLYNLKALCNEWCQAASYGADVTLAG